MSFRLFDVKEDQTKSLKLNQLHDDSPLVYYFREGNVMVNYLYFIFMFVQNKFNSQLFAF